MSNRTEIKRMFGTFWNQSWTDENLYNALITQTEFMFGELTARAAELPKFLNRFDIPTKRTSGVRYLPLNELQLTRKYRTLGSFNMDQGIRLDSLQVDPPVWIADSPVEGCLAITDSPVKAELMLERGTHFDIVDGKLNLYVDPFQEAFYQHLTIVDDEQVLLSDLWILHTEDDDNYLADHYGRIVNMLTPSSDYYRKTLNAVYDLLQEGATINRVSAFVGALLDTDVAKLDGTVIDVWNEGSRTWVMVDGVVHSCPGTGNAIVSPQDIVQTGDLLFNTFTINSGRESIDPGQFPQIILNRAYIDTPSGYGLTFENASVEVTDYKFPIGGDPGDVAAFWENAEAQAIERGIDLQEAIIGDQRAPYIVNPFEFIRTNFLSNAMVFITIELEALRDPEAIKLFRYLDAVLPASTTYVLNAFASVDTEADVSALTDEAIPAYAGIGEELDIITINDYIKGNEKLY
jgi:hypothetical protein